jgi:hypothetical protein
MIRLPVTDPSLTTFVRRRINSLALGVLAILIVTFIPAVVKPMTENQKHLKEAQAHTKAFEDKLEPELLREAYLALENVLLSEEDDPDILRQLRAESLNLWLHLIQLLDRFLDPKFNPGDVPGRVVQPPPTTGGVVYPPGADPALIDDPIARAQYEQEIAANRAKTVHYAMQVKLRRLDERIMPRAEAFIRNSYSSTPSDQAELKTAIDKMITNTQRKAMLINLLTPPQHRR